MVSQWRIILSYKMVKFFVIRENFTFSGLTWFNLGLISASEFVDIGLGELYMDCSTAP